MIDFLRIELRTRINQETLTFVNGAMSLSDDKLVIFKNGQFHFFKVSCISEFYIEMM